MSDDFLKKASICDTCGQPTSEAGGSNTYFDENGKLKTECFKCKPRQKGNRVNQFDRLAYRYGKGDIKLPRPDYGAMSRRIQRQMEDPKTRDRLIKQLPTEKQRETFNRLSKPKGAKTPKGLKEQ